jgi:hypothetical protein
MNILNQWPKSGLIIKFITYLLVFTGGYELIILSNCNPVTPTKEMRLSQIKIETAFFIS